MTVAAVKVMSLRLPLPPKAPIQNSPSATQTRMIGTQLLSVGSLMKLLISIAPYCLSRTATQNTGSEYRRNETKVMK